MASASVDPNAFSTPFSITKSMHRDPYPAISPENPKNTQKDRIIIITGASSGLGLAAAKVWARAGAKGIVLAARRIESLTKLAEEIKTLSPSTTVLAVKTDIVSEADAKNLFAKVQEKFGRAADVLLNNAGYGKDDSNIADTPVADWWLGIEINLKGAYIMTQHFIQSQADPKTSNATIITVSSGRAGLTGAGGSAYNISKLGEQRLNEHLQIENPHLRVFTTMPGIAMSEMVSEFWLPYAKDDPALTGMLALYLAQPRADFLKGSMLSVNWDVEELEQHEKEIVEGKKLQTSWMPVLPFNGGKGLGA